VDGNGSRSAGFSGRITGHYRRYPLAWHIEAWRNAGFVDIGVRVMSLGGGLVMWGTKADR
jgi:demethylmenaquinone methyltransferase / 2-methoxy-6-polyprenyl-1,4-benzoquinol methylase